MVVYMSVSKIKDYVRNHRKSVLFPVIGLGVVVFMVLVKSRSEPEKLPPAERVTVVRAIKAPKVSVVPRALGYGYVQPGQVWDAVAEVGGKIVDKNPNLKKGSIIGKDEVILIIDPKETSFAREQTEAEVQDILAQIQRLDQSESNTRSQLKIEKGKLALAQKELERNRKLFSGNVISKSELDAVEQNYLTQRNAVQTYQSTLNTIPAERQQLQAKLASARSQLADARLDEEKTVIRAPFDCRVSSETVELGQAVKTGDVLATLDSMNVSETFAQVPLYSFKNIVPLGRRPMETGEFTMSRIRDFLKLEAIVRLRLTDGTVEWGGRVLRISESVDPDTRTIGVYVAVDNPYLKVEGGKRPPLLKNMYAEVELRGQPREPAVIVPRSAVHASRVYVADKDDRLRIREVETYSPQSGFASLSKGVQAGERVIVSDVVPAIDGMLLHVVEDADALNRLVAEATGKGDVK